MNQVNELLFVGVLPLAVAAGAALAVGRLRATPAVIWAAGLAVGFVAGQLALASRAGFARALRILIEPREATDWLPHAVLLALGVTLLLDFAPRRWRQAVVALAGLLAVAVPARLLAGPVSQQWSAPEKVSHLALLAATLALVWLLLAAARDDEAPRLRQALLVLAAVGAAIVTTLSGSFTLGRLCGVVAAAVTGTALVGRRGLHGAAAIVAVSLGGLVILGVYYAKLHPANAALLLFSVVAAAGRLPEAVSRWPRRQQAALRVGFCAAPLIVALSVSLA